MRSEPVPFPFKSPVSVVEPVPPNPTPSVPKIELALKVVVAETTPCALVCRNPETAFEMVRFVVDAVEKNPVVAVRTVDDAYGKVEACDVEVAVK